MSDTSLSSPVVHVLYTGGTIGMQQTAEGLAPANGFDKLAREVQSSLNMHEPLPEWTLKELDPLIDSANLTPNLWGRLVEECLEAKANGAKSVLILHGTDTLAYTAAALSFLLAHFDLPVVITGSMLPAGAPESDAWENFFGGLSVCHTISDAGVFVQFHGRLMSGVACRKVASSGRDAFMPAFDIPVPYTSPSSLKSLPNFLCGGDYQSRFSKSVGIAELYPGITSRQLGALLDGVEALVLECYGSGTAPSEDDSFFNVLKSANERGVPVVGISLCARGGVTIGRYAAGSRLKDVGVVGGGGMTREAAFGKLYWLLNSNISFEEQQYWLEQNVLGERNEHADSL